MFVRCKKRFEDGKEHRYGSVAENVRGRCYNVVDPVNHHEAELRSTRQGGTADQLARRDFVILDELGTLPFATVLPLGRRAAAVPSDEPALRAHLDRHHPNLAFGEWPPVFGDHHRDPRRLRLSGRHHGCMVAPHHRLRARPTDRCAADACGAHVGNREPPTATRMHPYGESPIIPGFSWRLQVLSGAGYGGGTGIRTPDTFR